MQTIRILALLFSLAGIASAQIAPSIATQPGNSTNCPATTAAFTVVAAGTAPLAYQWYFNETNVIVDATNATVSVTNIAALNGGGYSVIVTNNDGSVTSIVALLVVNNATVATALNNTNTCAGSSVTFATTASGTGPFAYVWRKDGGAALGSTSNSLVLSPVVSGDAGVYSVEVTGTCNSVTNSATLGVTAQPSLAVSADTNNFCPGVPVILTATSGAASPGYLWSPGGQTTASVTNSPATTTIYTVTVTDGVTGCSSNASITVDVNVTTTTAIGNQTNCPGSSVTFATTASGTGPFAYVWRKDGGAALGSTSNSLVLSPVVSGDVGVYSVEVTGTCNSATNSGNLVVVGAPTITAQPQSQSTPMGNGAVFSVTATTVSGTVAPLSYQWSTNGVAVTGATGSSIAISNLVLSQSGLTFQVSVSNCAGGLLSSVATLTVTPVSGISFDFDTPGQFTNNPAENLFNDWLFTAQGSFITGFPGNQFVTVTYEVPAGGVNDSGALDIAFHANNNVENSITLLPQLFDFSLPGKTLIGSTMFKVKAPTSNGRHTQIGFVTSTNFGINDNTPQGFMTVILEATAQPALTYQLRLQHRRTDGGLTDVTPSATTSNLTAGNWYKVKATFMNITGVASNTIAISAELQDMGPNGSTPGAVVLSYAPTNIVNTSLVLQKYMMLAIRGFENKGLDFRDNIYAHSATGPVVMAAQPDNQTVQQGRSATFRAYANGDGPYTYQWNKNGVPIGGARNWKHITPPTATGDNSAQYTVTVTGPGVANSVTSAPATLTVQSDPLNVVSVGSVDGCIVGVRFDQAVDPATAENPANYLINGVAATSAEVYRSSFGVQGRDGVYVLLTPASVLSGAFTVTVQNVRDLSGNAIASPNNSGAGAVEGLTGVDIDPAQARVLGVNYSFAPGQLEIIGGGHDIFGTSDSLRYVYAQKTGDFDLKVQLTDHWTTRAPAKAGLEVRASLAPNSPQVLLSPNPRRPARNIFEATSRPTFGAATVAWGPNVSMDAAGYPNAWVRLRRSGDVFLRYSSTNGVNWQLDAQLTQPMPNTVYVGLGVCANVGANNPMFPHGANFEQYGDFGGYVGATIAITQQPTNVTISAGGSTTLAVTATLTGGPAQELSYLFQRSNGVSGWVNLPGTGATNTASTGPLYFADSGAQYRVVIKAPGAAAATSDVVTVTVTDTAVPTIASTTIPAGSAQQFAITFSEPVSAATALTSALNPANYVVTNSAGTVLGIANIAFHGDARTVIITLSDVIAAGNYGVRVSGVQDLNGNTVATVVRTFSQTFTLPVSGPVVVEIIGNITGGDLAALATYTNSAKFTARNPDFIVYSNLFAHQLSLANSGLDNYGARVFSYFVAPSNGLYKFWVRSDDSSRLFMNTNAANSTLRSGAVFLGENTANNATYTLKGQNIQLTGGQSYYLEVLVKEGTGGDGVSVAVRAQADAAVPPVTEAILASMLAFPASEALPTPVTLEIYTGLSGSTTADLINATNSQKFISGTPDVVSYEKYFGHVNDLANSGLDNYLGKLYGYFVAPSNGVYKFWVRSDDASQLYMNTNSVNSTDPAGKVLLGALGGFTGNYTLVAQNIDLVAGQRYYMEGLFKEGGGGDGMMVAIRAQSDVNPPPSTDVIPASMLRFPADQARFGAISLAGILPASPVVTAGQTVTLTARGIKGAPLTSITWLRNGVVVALSPSVTTPPLTMSDNGAVYTLIVSNAFSRAESSVAVTVNADAAAPTLLSAVASQYGDGVTLTFSEALDEVTATCAVNYSINGLNIVSAVLDITGGNRVFLRTSPHVPGTAYTVTVNGVRDASTANLVAANSAANFGGWNDGGFGVLVEIFTNITGGNEIGRLTGHYKYINNLPDERGYIPGLAFGTNPQGGIPVFNFRPAGNLDNYGARLTTYFVAPSNGLYRFYIRGDDATQLYMNPDGAAPGGRMLIARNDNANSLTYDNGVGGSASPALSLVAGQAYYTEALMKEGTGGDYVTVAWRPVDPVTLTAIGGIPTTNSASITQPFLKAVGDPAMFQITGTPPATLTVGENDQVDLRLTGTVNPTNIITAIFYQWQRFDSVGLTFTNIIGSTNGNLTTFFAQFADAGQYRLQATVPGRGDLSYVTILTVTNDLTGPFIVSANSLDGSTVGVCFNEPVDPNSANQATNYYFNNDLNLNPISAVVRAEDPRTVLLTMASPLTGSFTLNARSIGDFATTQNLGNSAVTGSVQNLTPMDIGAPLGAGSTWTCVSNEFDVVAGGADIWDASDQGHFTIGTRTGNFDVWTQVASLSRAPLDNDNITKAGIMIRETLDANARKLHYLAEPPVYSLAEPPVFIGGRDIYEAGQRPAVNAGTAAWSGGNGDNGVPAGIPNTWIRIKRVGDLFTAYRSSNGVDWVQTTTHTMSLPRTVYVGLAATAHIPSPSTATTLAKFRNVHIPNPPTITTQPSPASQTVPIHAVVTYSVVGTNLPNSGPLVYQWRLNDAFISGATNDTLTLTNASVADSGAYTVDVGNDGGAVISLPVSLIVSNALVAANNDSITVTQGSTTNITATNLSANDSDPEGDPISVIGVSGLYPATFISDFNSGVPAGSAVFGTAIVDTAGGVNGSGALKITMNVTNQSGAFILNDLSPGRSVSAFQARFKLRIGDGSAEPADGFSFNFAPDLPIAATGPRPAEDGMGSGFSFCVDNYRFSGPANTSGIKIRYGGVDIAGVQIPGTWNSPRYIPVSIAVTAEGQATVMVDGTNVFGALSLPGYTARSGRFGMYARTGGQNMAQWVDDLAITSVLTVETAAGGQVTFTNGIVTYQAPPCGGPDTFYYLVSDGQIDGVVPGLVNVSVTETNPAPPVIVTCATNRTYTLYTNTQMALPDLRGELVVTDNCGVPTITQSPPAGTLLNAGTTNVVTFTATDTTGSNATCQATVIVELIRLAFIPGSARYNNGTFSASFQTVNGVNYGIEYRDLVHTGPWIPLTTITGDGTVMSFTDPGPLPPMRFYRIVPQP